MTTPTPGLTGPLLPSFIRTYVPLLVGALASWLISLGVPIDDGAKAALVTFLGAAVSGVYYALVRVLEQKFPALTLLLGSTAQPSTYTTSTPAVVVPAGAPVVTEAPDDDQINIL